MEGSVNRNVVKRLCLREWADIQALGIVTNSSRGLPADFQQTLALNMLHDEGTYRCKVHFLFGFAPQRQKKSRLYKLEIKSDHPRTHSLEQSTYEPRKSFVDAVTLCVYDALYPLWQ